MHALPSALLSGISSCLPPCLDPSWHLWEGLPHKALLWTKMLSNRHNLKTQETKQLSQAQNILSLEDPNMSLTRSAQEMYQSCLSDSLPGQLSRAHSGSDCVQINLAFKKWKGCPLQVLRPVQGDDTAQEGL